MTKKYKFIEEQEIRNDVNTWLNKLPQINKTHWNYREEVEHDFKNIANYANHFETSLKLNESIDFDYLEEKLNFMEANLHNIRNICLTWKKTKGKN